MGAVTFFARRRIRIIFRIEDAVNALLEDRTDFCVARGAIDGLRDRVAGAQMGRIYFTVALTARHVRVARAAKFLDAHREEPAVF